jgi:voltage-gated potassium channel
VLHRRALTARRAAAIIGFYTVGITVIGGVVARLADRHDFSSFGTAIWWALQTVTTVGYGDVVPKSASGRAVGGLLMVSGIAFLAVVTASVTAALVEAARARSRTAEATAKEISDRLAAMEARFDKLEAALRAKPE